MKINVLLIPFLSSLCFLCTSTNADNVLIPDRTINIATIDWCPSICDNEETPGYIVETVEEVFSNSRIQLKYHYMPWARAVKQVQQGNFDAVLSPIKSEAPELLYPQHEVGLQNTCFYTLSTDPWQYKDITSLYEDRQVLRVRAHSLLELDLYATKHPEIFTVSNFEGFLEHGTRMLELKKFNTLVFTENETLYFLSEKNMLTSFKQSGCINSEKLYMAFSRLDEHRSKKLIQIFDERMTELKANGRLNQILESYNLPTYHTLQDN